MNQKDERDVIARAIKDFSGDMTTLEGAIGAYFVGKELGWKPMLLIHEKRTIKKYEGILRVNFREVHTEEGPLAKKSLAWRASQRVSNFWKAVKGEVRGVRSPKLV